MTFFVKQNDTSPKLAATLKDGNGQVVDVTGASVRFHMARMNSNTAVVDAAGTVTNGGAGAVEYAWTPSNTANVGTYRGEFEVTFPSGLVETYPNAGYVSIQVTDDIA